MERAGAGGSADAASRSTAARLWGGADTDASLEVYRKDVEARLAEHAAAEEAEAKEATEHRQAKRDEADARSPRGWQAVKAQLQKLGARPPAPPPAREQRSTEAHAPARPPGARPGATATSAARLAAIGPVPTALSGSFARLERPPDAFALLKEARERGVLFVEDSLQDGHSEDGEDPVLAAAVEECIRICFGVRGILRIGPGKNDALEPIIVVSTTQGFSEQSLERVPARVHGFATLLAIPFDLLPLRRER